MKRLILFLALSLLFVGCSPERVPKNSTPVNTTQEGVIKPATATPIPAELKASDYFVFNKDTHKVFKGTGNEYAPYDTYVDYIKDNIAQERLSNGGTVSVSVFRLQSGTIKRVFRQGESYHQYDYTGSTNLEEILLKEPIKIGTSWNLSDGGTRNITAIEKKIELPLGTYSALEVTTNRPDSITKDYYVKGLGHVKSEFGTLDSPDKIVSELEKVEKGVPYPQTINFYFPQFEKDRIVYVTRKIDTYTNTEMKAIFQKELKNIPVNSDLSSTLSLNTKILNIKVEDEKGIITVDLSSEFLKEMNAGAGFESMLINSVTNTLGNYYQKDKVIITIEGKPYESGHFSMKPGEYFTVKQESIQEYK